MSLSPAFDSDAVARIWTVSDGEKVLELQASAGMDSCIDDEQARIPIGKLRIGRIAESGEVDVTDNVPEELLPASREWTDQEKMTAFAGCPLKVNGRIIGVAAAFAREPSSQAALQTFASTSDRRTMLLECCATGKWNLEFLDGGRCFMRPSSRARQIAFSFGGNRSGQ